MLIRRTECDDRQEVMSDNERIIRCHLGLFIHLCNIFIKRCLFPHEASPLTCTVYILLTINSPVRIAEQRKYDLVNIPFQSFWYVININYLPNGQNNKPTPSKHTTKKTNYTCIEMRNQDKIYNQSSGRVCLGGGWCMGLTYVSMSEHSNPPFSIPRTRYFYLTITAKSPENGRKQPPARFITSLTVI